jgi:sortase A
LEDLLIDKTRYEKEELILYTCYPFHAITGRKTDRLVVFADRTAGRDVIWKEETT